MMGFLSHPFVRRWGPHVAVAAAYIGLYPILRLFSFSHFMLPSGLRIVFLLMVPYRFWPALVIGESAGIALSFHDGWGKYGWMWTVCMLIPPITLGMPLAWYCREKLQPFRRGSVSLSAVLALSVGASVLWTLANLATYLNSNVVSTKGSTWNFVGRWLIGNYVGDLTITPTVLVLVLAASGLPVRAWWSNLRNSVMVRELAFVYLPIVIILSVWSANASADLKQVIQLAMGVPIVVAAFRHNWRGAALVGTAVSIGILYPRPLRYDIATMQAQLLVAFLLTTTMLWSESMAKLAARATALHKEAQDALALAKRNAILGEAQLQHASNTLLQVREQFLGITGIPHEEPALVARVRAADERLASLADYLYPSVWEARGLPAGLSATLRQGDIARTLSHAGILYWCEFDRVDLAGLPSKMNVLLYRLVLDGIGTLCAERNVNDVRVRLRNGSFAGRHWVMFRIEGRTRLDRAGQVHWSRLEGKFEGATANLEAIGDRVAAYGGTARLRVLKDRTRRLSAFMIAD
jgi:hypothetical protein